MVWNSTQSALYRAVNAYNVSGEVRENAAQKSVRENVQKNGGFSSGNSAKHNTEKRTENHSQNRCRNCSKNVPNDPVSRIMSDGDMMLIAGLIFVLWHENADKKLILALATVLLG